MGYFLKKGFSHVVVLQPVVFNYKNNSGKIVSVENCFATEYTGYAIVQQYYHWTDAPMQSLFADEVARFRAENGWKVVRFDAVFDEDGFVFPLCNPLVTCVTLAKSLLGVQSWSQTPYQFYRWLLKNGGVEIKGDLNGKR